MDERNGVLRLYAQKVRELALYGLYDLILSLLEFHTNIVTSKICGGRPAAFDRGSPFTVIMRPRFDYAFREDRIVLLLECASGESGFRSGHEISVPDS